MTTEEDEDFNSSVIYAIVVVIAVACIFIMMYTGIRRIIATGKGRSISNPWLIPYNDLKFIDLSSSESSQNMSIQSIKQKLAEGNQTKKATRNRLFASVDQLFVMCDKYVIRDKIRYDKVDLSLLYQLRSHVQHDNLNGFVGLSFDRYSHIFVIQTQCFRGSLHDHIFSGKPMRDTSTNFEGAFLRDILKGLEYIHTSSSIDFHGNLTLFNCMLDSHWIVKLGGFGLNRLLIKWKAGGQIFTEDHTPLIRSEELHYFDPALKKIWKEHTGTKTDKALISADFGKRCDMYGFGVCLYEIIFKKKFVENLYDTPSESEDESILLDEANDIKASKYPLPIIIPENMSIHNDLLKNLENCFGTNRPDVTLVRKVIDTVLKMQGSLVDLMIKNLTSYTDGLNQIVLARTLEFQNEQKKSDELLQELIPQSVAADLKLGKRIEAKMYPSATILYSDIVGFTSLCSESKPMEVVNLLSGMYLRFDLIISQQGGYKMETIGDAYCVAAGLPIPSKHKHVNSICMIALLQRECLHQFEIPHRPGKYLNCRWGFNTGSVFSGVIGAKAPRYACFGEAVTLASKMESNGMEDRIQMTLASQQLLEEYYPEFVTHSRGGISIDGYGFLITYWLEGLEKGAEDRLREFQKALSDTLTTVANTPDVVKYEKPKDKMTIAKEKVMAERRQEEERLTRQQTLHEALEEHEEEVEMNVVLKDDDAKGDSVDLASIISTPTDEDNEEEEDEGGRTIGHGRLDSQASTIPEN